MSWHAPAGGTRVAERDTHAADESRRSVYQGQTVRPMTAWAGDIYSGLPSAERVRAWRLRCEAIASGVDPDEIERYVRDGLDRGREEAYREREWRDLDRAARAVWRDRITAALADTTVKLDDKAHRDDNSTYRL